MKSKTTFLSFCFLLLVFSKSLPSYGQEAPPVFDWQSAFGGTSYDAASKIIHSADGGYIIVGVTYSHDCEVTGNHGSGDVWVVKIDSKGSMQWQKALGGSNIDAAVAAAVFPNGNIYIASNTNSVNGNVTSNHGSSDIWIVALDKNGNLVWQKTYGGSSDDFAHALIKTHDDHLVIGGNSQSYNGDLTANQGSDDFWLVKIDTLGNIAWQKSFGGSASDVCNGVAEMEDGGYVAVGSSISVDGDVTGNHGGSDYWVVKTDANGNLDWQKSLGGSSNESALAVIKNSDGNIVMAGYTNSNDGDVKDNKGSSDYWMVMLDETDSLLMQATYGGSNSDVAYSIVEADDRGYLISGGSLSMNFDVPANHGGEDFWLLKTDEFGNMKWSRTYGGATTDRNTSTIQTDDGGYMMAGYTFSNNNDVSGNHGSADMWVAKLSCKTPVSSFAFADDTVCINSIINLTNTSANSAVYSWLADGISFGNNTDASFQFNSLGTYTISLVASTCYESNASAHVFTVIDHPAPQIASTKSYLCDGETEVLNTQYSVSGTYLWNTGETTASIQVNSGGDYSITVTFHQCSGTSAVLHIAQYPQPQFSLGNDTAFCSGNVFSLSAPTGYQGYLWQDGSTNPSFNATTSGQYFVTVDNGHCSFTDTINLVAKTDCNFPIAEFSTDKLTICENTCIDFRNQSANATSWNWQFDGATPSSSTDRNPSGICYHAAGTYSVSLTVSNNNGSASQTQRDYIVVVSYPPTPIVTLTGFILESTLASTYQWFTNGHPITGATSPAYAADFSGYYYVMTGNDAGCTAFSDSVYFDVTGIAGLAISSKEEVYPNPATDRLWVMSDGLWVNPILEIYNVLGENVYHLKLETGNSKLETAVDVSSFAKGTYVLQLTSADKTYRTRFVVER